MRVNASDVMVQIDGINAILEKQGSAWRMKFEPRYGYYVIQPYKNNAPYSDPLFAGTKKECREYVAAMLRGMWLARDEY